MKTLFGNAKAKRIYAMSMLLALNIVILLLPILSVTVGATSPQGNWEYQGISSSTEMSLASQLNDLTKEGWEPVFFSAGSRSNDNMLYAIVRDTGGNQEYQGILSSTVMSLASQLNDLQNSEPVFFSAGSRTNDNWLYAIVRDRGGNQEYQGISSSTVMSLASQLNDQQSSEPVFFSAGSRTNDNWLYAIVRDRGGNQEYQGISSSTEMSLASQLNDLQSSEPVFFSAGSRSNDNRLYAIVRDTVGNQEYQGISSSTEMSLASQLNDLQNSEPVFFSAGSRTNDNWLYAILRRDSEAMAVPEYVPVTNITDVPTTAMSRIPLTLTGTVHPTNATNKTITWSVVTAGTTGATINGRTLNTTAAGTVRVRATIANGVAMGTPYTQEFDIIVSNAYTNFIPTVDGFSFVNTGSSFGYPFLYRIPAQRYIEVYGQSLGMAHYDDQAKGARYWGGSCFGFSVISTKFYNGNLNISNYGGSTTYSIPAPRSTTHQITQLIERAQISWWLPGVPTVNFDSDALISASENFAADGTNPIIMYIDALQHNEDPFVHAVVPWKVERIGSDTRIYVYEVNRPGEEELYFAIHGNGSFSTNTDSRIRTISRLGFVRLQQVLDGEADMHQELMYISVDKMAAHILASSGQSVENLPDAQRVYPMPANDPGNAHTDFTAYWLPVGEYTVVVQSDDPVSIIVSEDWEAFSINLIPKANSITIEIGKTVEIEGAAHGSITVYQDDGTELLLPIIAGSVAGLSTDEGVEVARFDDVRVNDWFEPAVTSMSSSGVVLGVGDNRYDPQGRLTVAQWVAMLMRTQYGQMPGGSPWYTTYIAQAERDGVLYGSDNLDPNAEITRAQMALITTSFIERFNPRWAKERVTTAPIDIATVPNAYRSAVEKAYAWNIVRGDNENRFNPNSTLTRAEAAQVLFNYFRIVD